MSTSSSSHRKARMMLDMMPSEPLPAITFSTFTSNCARQHFAQIQPAVGIKVQARRSAPVMASMAFGEAPSGILVGRELRQCASGRTACGPIRWCAPLHRAAGIRYKEERVASVYFQFTARREVLSPSPVLYDAGAVLSCRPASARVPERKKSASSPPRLLDPGAPGWSPIENSGASVRR